jgi:hypothetical protein
MDWKLRVKLSQKGGLSMGREDTMKRINLLLQRIEQNVYNGVRTDPDFVFAVNELRASFEREAILLDALDSYGGQEADSVVDHFRHPAQPDSF